MHDKVFFLLSQIDKFFSTSANQFDLLVTSDGEEVKNLSDVRA